MPVRVVVVDDEALSRRRLSKMIISQGNMDIVGEASDGLEALEVIEKAQPDVVFLDIQMPKMDGLSVAKALSHPVQIIFTTAFDKYAVDAFDAAAVDYLLKPVGKERLKRALDRVRQDPPDRSAEKKKLAELLEHLIKNRHQDPVPRVLVKERDTTLVFDARLIPRFYSESKYSSFQQAGKEHLLDESLSSLEKRLSRWGFMRTHRSELVNLHHVRSLNQDPLGAFVSLSSGETAKVSRRMLAKIRQWLEAR